MTIRRMMAIAATAATVAGLVGTAAAPAGAADDLDRKDYLRFQTAIAGQVDRYWSALAPGYGVTYRPAKYVVVPAGKVRKFCGGYAGDPADNAAASPAFYCPSQQAVVLSAGWMYRDIYRQFGDFGAAVVVAHEWGHHVQRVAGLTAETSKARELQADCYAGVWVRDAFARGQMSWGDLVEAGYVLHEMGDHEVDAPDHHGTPQERVEAFADGARDGDPAAC